MFRVAFAVILLAACAVAQKVTVVNTSAFKRTSWTTCVVPDANLPKTPIKIVPGDWPAFFGEKTGARGRYLHIRATIDAYSRVVGKVELAGPPDVKIPPKKGRKRIPGEAPDTPDTYECPEELQPLVAAAAPAATNPVPVFRVNGHELEVLRFDPVEQGPARTVMHMVGRVQNTQMCFNGWFYIYSASRVVPFEVAFTNSDFTNQAPTQKVDSITMQCSPSCAPVVDFLKVRGGKDATPNSDKTSTVTLGHSTWLGHGQTMAYVGRLAFFEKATPVELESLFAAKDSPLHSLCPEWEGHWGPWGKMPILHPSENTKARRFGHAASKAQFDKLIRAMNSGQHTGSALWAQNAMCAWGTNNRPKDTGDQRDFGITGCDDVLGPKDGDPVTLWLMWPSLLRDIARPSVFYEENGNPLIRSDHPDWATWGLHTHYSNGMSPDQLGKAAGSQKSNTLFYKDFAHASSNFYGGHGVLSGSYLVKHMGQHEQTAIEAYTTFFGLGQTRAWGRTPLAYTWHYLANGDKARLDAFATQIAADDKLWKPIRDGATNGHTVITRLFKDGKYHWHMPWHDALAIHGLDALFSLSPHAEAEELLNVWCTSWVKRWYKKEGRWTIPQWEPWHNGQSVNSDIIRDVFVVNDPDGRDARYFYAPHWPGTAYDQWCAPTLIVCRRRAQDEQGQLAQEIFESVWARWVSQKPGGFDRGSTWLTSIR